jgi:LacI family transcriptional regulator
MPPTRPTLQQIAERTGYSASTVSRALRGDPRVTATTRERIRDVADTLGFSRNAVASTLRSGGPTSIIGLIVPDFRDPFFAAVAAGVQEAAARLDREVLVGCHHQSPTEQDRLLRRIVSHRVGAVIIVPAPAGSARRLGVEAAFGTRVVAVDQPAPDLDCDLVTTDNAGGASTLAAEMLRRGHRRFVIVGQDLGLHTQYVRLDAVLEVLREAGVTIDRGGILSADHGGRLDAGVVDECLRTFAPTAVIGLAVLPTLDALAGAHRLGLAVEFASFDSAEVYDLVDDWFYCVDQDAAALGRTAVEVLTQAPDPDGAAPREIVVPLSSPVIRGRRAHA